MRLVFMGAPAFAVPTLRALAGAGHDIAAVYTRAPKPAGRRGLAPTKTSVHLVAEEFGVEVRTPTTLRDPREQADLAALGADVAIVVAYGLILPRAALDAPRLGCLNLHGSLLPRWRGAAPIQRAIMAGDAETGVMVMRMEEGLDTGPVALSARTPIGETTTAGDLEASLSRDGAALMVEAVARLAADDLVFVPQAEAGATYAAKIAKDETRIDWSRPAHEVARAINGLSPAPGAWFMADLGAGPERVKALRAAPAEGEGEDASGTVLDETLRVACGSGALRLLEVQRAGKGAMPAQEFLHGAKLAPGARLG
ncbi:MAG: methionyl-tRNA formyltransferase [Hyphomicrobiales bacterium]|nr:methionyl-tRNA formyltransferase [Hyphomicrobiales bacterium]MDE2016130.1 methionyl-tRNA formyltransferase [Hyphomicrobiales bacterium]